MIRIKRRSPVLVVFNIGGQLTLQGSVISIAYNGQGLPQAVKSNGTSGRAALQIYFN